jgi:hypothetical protein
MKTFKRWNTSKLSGKDYETFFLSKSSLFKKYTPNMYILNRACLKIQHAYVQWRIKKNPEEVVEEETKIVSLLPIGRNYESERTDLGQSPTYESSVSPGK